MNGEKKKNTELECIVEKESQQLYPYSPRNINVPVNL